ncbi:MAG: T9SS type A sorting domain-containing protein [Saprospiraceae bacterium]|nr:T9SS type A sorting domain-containing protein [Saprospiraceae bacterium]
MNRLTTQTCIVLMCLLGSTWAAGQGYRTIDGFNNNLIYKSWGAAGENQLTLGTIGYADGISEPAGPDRPNARAISNLLFTQNTMANDPIGLSAYCWGWGQFIDHDITLVKDNAAEGLTIPIPTGDAFFDPAGTGTKFIPMARSESDPVTGTSTVNPRKHVNAISAFIDASTVYGSDEDRATWLRTFSGGRLKISYGNLLPWNTTTGEYGAPIDPAAPEMAMPLPNVKKWFVAGDVRANENPFLTSLHTVFVREHNRLCAELEISHPTWTDEQLYQHARRLVAGLVQQIVYGEWLPALGMEVPVYSLYDPFTNPGIMNVFSAAAYRYGHTTINSLLVRMNDDGYYIAQGDLLLRDAFFNPTAIQDVDGIEPYLIGMATVVQQDFDCKVIDDLRNFLFGKPGAGGMDLAAINIVRGRERGLADYNSIRADFGLQPFTDFTEFSADPLMNQTLEFVYGSVDQVDPWVGMLAEDHMPGALFGHTAMTIIRKQFLALRDGDRYYFENDIEISEEEKEWIRKVHLADIIKRNAGVTIVHDDLFTAKPLVSSHQWTADQQIDFALYPNPVRDRVVLRIPSDDHHEAIIRITNGAGQEVLQRVAGMSQGNNTLTISLPTDWPAGIYQLSVQGNNRSGIKSFVKVE